MKETTCLICGKSDADRLAQYEHDPYHRHLDHLKGVPVTYVVCRSCGFVYTNPMLDEQELATLYGEKLRPSAPDPGYLKANERFICNGINRSRVGAFIADQGLVEAVR